MIQNWEKRIPGVYCLNYFAIYMDLGLLGSQYTGISDMQTMSAALPH